MKHNPAFSLAVLLSSYNGERYIEQQVDSILSQELEGGQLHIYVRDDGSTDRTLEILQNYKNNCSNLSVIEGENIGYIASFLTLINLMNNSEQRYDFYSLSDQDDVWDKDKLLHAVNKLRACSGIPALYQSASRVVTKHLDYIRTGQACIKEITFFNTIIQTFSPGHTYVLNQALLKKVDSDLDYSKLYGHDAYLTNLAVLTGKIIFDNTPHASYRQHGGNQLGSSFVNGVSGWFQIRIKRIFQGHGGKYAEQIEYIYKKHKEIMTDEQRKEINLFLHSRKSFFTRLRYVFRAKLYRQKSVETVFFKLLYLAGGYNNARGSKR